LIIGTVTDERVPMIELELAGNKWNAVIDTGFNGDLELPLELLGQLHCTFAGRIKSYLAGGLVIKEDVYDVEFPFDGERVLATATFSPGNEILIGTRLLKSYRLEIDFPARTLLLARA
jgi:clan AA aspartic protease